MSNPILVDLNKIEIPEQVVNQRTLEDFKIPPVLKSKLNNYLKDRNYHVNDYSSYGLTDSNAQNYAVLPNQYFSFACEISEFAIEVYKYFELFEKLRSQSALLLGSSEEIQKNIHSNLHLKSQFNNDSDVKLFSDFIDVENTTYRFNAKDFINSQGKARSSKDCFSSVILKVVNMPDASSSIFGQLVYELVQKQDLYKELHSTYRCHVQSRGSIRQEEIPVVDIADINIPKPFLLLAGISGTGKTRFVRKQAEASSFGRRNYCLVPVRPDWHEPSDLLGYVTRISASGPRYVVTDVLKFIVAAWKEAAVGVNGDSIDLKEDYAPFWLCLDEMNLAPVEQYFADYLSVLETRKWQDGLYSCEPLLKSDLFTQLDDAGKNQLKIDLGLQDGGDELWDFFVVSGIAIPPNLIVAGTVNMDETTHGFSRKVIDRALTIDFGEFFPNDYQLFLNEEGQPKPKILGCSKVSQASLEGLADVTVDSQGKVSTDFLEAVNSVLKGTPYELAYRALNELLISVICFNPSNEQELQAVWDDFLMAKVLPRIEGDRDKLQTAAGTALLESLEIVLQDKLESIVTAEKRPDLFREGVDGTDVRSIKKLKWMATRLENNGFTAFWP